MILCARNTSRSREQSKKRRSRSENMWKVCLFCSQNRRKKVIMKHDRHICLRNSLGAQRFWVLYPWLCFSDAHWLGRQTPIIWSYEVLLQWYLSQEDTGKVSTLGRGYLSEASLHGRCPPIKVKSTVFFQEGMKWESQAPVDRFHVTSLPPCWTITKCSSLASSGSSSNMAAVSLTDWLQTIYTEILFCGFSSEMSFL